MLDILNVELGLRHEDIIVGRNTGSAEFTAHVHALGKFKKLSDFLVVLDGDSRSMENKLKKVAAEYGHPLQPLFLPGETSPEQWLWEIIRTRPNDYALAFGLSVADMRSMTDRVAQLVEGALQQRDRAKAAVQAFAEDIEGTVPEIARRVARSEANSKEMTEFLTALREQISSWRRY